MEYILWNVSIYWETIYGAEINDYNSVRAVVSLASDVKVTGDDVTGYRY